MAATATKAYRDHTLGNTAEAVLKAFYSQIGSGGLKPFGRDVHQGFEFFCTTTASYTRRSLA